MNALSSLRRSQLNATKIAATAATPAIDQSGGRQRIATTQIAAATASSESQAYYSTGSRSGPWYSLVAGDYSDYAAAQAAAAKLTADSPALKPWIRRFDEIQAKMR